MIKRWCNIGWYKWESCYIFVQVTYFSRWTVYIKKMALFGCAVGILASFLSLDRNLSRLNLHFVDFFYGRIFDVINGTLIKQLCISSIQVQSLRRNALKSWRKYSFECVQTKYVLREVFFARFSKPFVEFGISKNFEQTVCT